MAYCTLADIKLAINEDKLIELTDTIESDTVDSDKINRAIANADAEIDLWCRSKYTVPFTTIDNAIRKISVDIAIYNLFPRSESIPEIHATLYTNAVERLKAIRDGELRLDVEEIGPAAHATEVMPEFTRGKVDEDGNLLGNVMGNWNDEAGSLDDW